MIHSSNDAWIRRWFSLLCISLFSPVCGCLTVALHHSCCSSGPISLTHWVIWAALTSRIFLRGGHCSLLWLIYAQRWRDTGRSSLEGVSRASSPPAGRVGLRFTAVLNGPWESSVMDSLELQHTLALCVRGSWTFSHTLLVAQVSFLLSSPRRVSLPLDFPICVLLRGGELGKVDVAGCWTRQISHRACECHQEGEGSSVLFISTLQSALSQQQDPVVVMLFKEPPALIPSRGGHSMLCSDLFPATSVCWLPTKQLKTCTYSIKLQISLPVMPFYIPVKAVSVITERCFHLANQFQKSNCAA